MAHTPLFWEWSIYLAHIWEDTLRQPVYPTLYHLAGTNAPFFFLFFYLKLSQSYAQVFALHHLSSGVLFYHKHGCPSPRDIVTEEDNCESTAFPTASPLTLKKSFRACSTSECWFPRSRLNMNILVTPSTPSLLLTLPHCPMLTPRFSLTATLHAHRRGHRAWLPKLPTILASQLNTQDLKDGIINILNLPPQSSLSNIVLYNFYLLNYQCTATVPFNTDAALPTERNTNSAPGLWFLTRCGLHIVPRSIHLLSQPDLQDEFWHFNLQVSTYSDLRLYFQIHSPLYPSIVWVWMDCILSWLCYFTHTWHAPVFPCSPMMLNPSSFLVLPFAILPTIYIILLFIVSDGSPIKLYTASGKNLPWLYYESPFLKFMRSTQFY